MFIGHRVFVRKGHDNRGCLNFFLYRSYVDNYQYNNTNQSGPVGAYQSLVLEIQTTDSCDQCVQDPGCNSQQQKENDGINILGEEANKESTPVLL